MSNQRRRFLAQSATLALGVTALPSFANSFTSKLSAADQINVGVIGCNGMGWSNLQAILKQPNIRCIALCDVDENVLTKR